MKKICVIGAGAAGLCVAKHSLEKRWQVVVYEKSNQIGGTWVYHNDISTDSSMYKNLKTNLPKEVMHFPGFPFSSNQPSFISHESVLDYLKSYAFHYNLMPYIKLNHNVKLVEPVTEENPIKWRVYVQSTNSESAILECNIFDSVFVCNGHYSKPYIPKLTGWSDFSGIQIHSHFYKVPEIYSGKRVAVLGAGPSGIDIGLEIAEYANFVYLCHNKKPFVGQFPENFIQKPGFVALTSNAVQFDINSNEPDLQVDVVIYCTGYEYKFDFFDQNKFDLQVAKNRVAPLYLHMVHVKYPNIFFIGLCFTICPFPHFDVQVRYALSIVSGETVLPSEQEMNDWIDNDINYRLKHVQSKQFHFLGPMQWEYLKLLASLGDFDYQLLVPNIIERIYDFMHEYRAKNLATYKSLNIFVEDDTFYYKNSDDNS